VIDIIISKLAIVMGPFASALPSCVPTDLILAPCMACHDSNGRLCAETRTASASAVQRPRANRGIGRVDSGLSRQQSHSQLRLLTVRGAWEALLDTMVAHSAEVYFECWRA
jgi:hypothetical protein